MSPPKATSRRHVEPCKLGDKQPRDTQRKSAKDKGKAHQQPKQARNKKRKKKTLKKKPDKPCAFETLKISCEHCKPTPKDKKKGKAKSGGGRRQGGYEYKPDDRLPNLFAVTADPEKGEFVTIEMADDHGYCSGYEGMHGTVHVFQANKCLAKAKKKLRFKAKPPVIGQTSKKKPGTIRQWLAIFSKANFKSSYYLVMPPSCGHPHTKGRPVHSVAPFHLRAYPNDEYKFAITCRLGAKVARGRAGEVVNRKLVKKDDQPENLQNPGLISLKLSRTRGGVTTELERPPGPEAWVNRYGMKFKRVEGMVKKVIRNVPKLGWSFDWDIEWFVGSAEIGWGYREYPEQARAPYRVDVYWWWMLKLQMTIIKGKIELHFGIILPVCELTVFGRLEGAIPAKFELEKKPHGGRSFLTGNASIGGKVELTIGVKGGVKWLAVIEGSLKSGIEAAGRIIERRGEHATVLFDLHWLGAEGSITVKTLGGWRKRQYKKKLFDKKKLGVWRLPDGAPVAHC